MCLYGLANKVPCCCCCCYPWIIIIPFSKHWSKRKLSQKFKRCVNWPILQIKIEKETYSWDFCKILSQLNCLFAEINVQRLLIKENFKNWKDVFGCPIVFLYSGERGHVAALLALKAKWFATLNKNNENNDEQCCVDVFADRWKDSAYEQGEYRTVIRFSR